jgi:adenine-specific DNA-methyltransferase
MGARKKKNGATTSSPKTSRAESYTHVTAEVPSRPEIGTQAQFRQKRPAKTYKYDSSLSPALDWDASREKRSFSAS